ncbi:MAG: NUDIX domain-containing protein [Proteobacteria bacterium]|nr:NUDIX domain-containing protein [Pseudomonadota bacterium]
MPLSPSPRPLDAATLILLRGRGARLEVLIGRRADSARFMPGRYVFPGGRVAPADRRPWAGETAAPLRYGPAARAAVRETFEETGLLVGRPARAAPPRASDLTPIERGFIERGLAPALEGLAYLGRAITPSSSAIRFNARFFLADGDDAVGELGGGAELVDLHWRDVDAEPPGPLPVATGYYLKRAVALWRGGERTSGAPLLYFVKSGYRIRGDPLAKRR